MEIESAYKVLEEQKQALEKLLIGYREKLELSDNLKKAYDELFPKYQEARKEIDKQRMEIATKSEEKFVLTKTCEDLKSSLHEKECAIKQVNSANEQIQMTSRQKVEEVEERNRELASALHDANSKSEELERMVDDFRKEIEGLRTLLSESRKQCIEVEKRVQDARELREREEAVLRAEHEKAKIGEQLKWKVEQFKHLEEAHGKLQQCYLESEKEWKVEKTRLFDETCNLQTKLEFHTRSVEDLQSRLQMCHQALAHEESRRKLLEIQVSEFQVSYESIAMECGEVKSEIEKLTKSRDEEIAKVRDLLASKESLLKEVGLQNMLLEQENRDLKASTEELKNNLEAGFTAKIEVDKAEKKMKLVLARELEKNVKRIEELQQEVVRLREELLQSEGTQFNMEVEIKDLKIECETLRKELEALHRSNKDISTAAEEQNRLLAREMSAKEIVVENLQQEIAHLEQELLEMRESKSDSEYDRKCLLEKFESVKKDLEASVHAKMEAEELLEKQIRDSTRELELKDNKIEDLLLEIDSLREESVERSKLKLDAEDAVRALQDENEATRKELESLIHDKMRVEEALELEKRYFARETEQQEIKMADLLHDFARLQNDLRHMSDLNENASAEIRALQSECDGLRKEMEVSIDEKEQRIRKLQQEITHMHEDVAIRLTEARECVSIQVKNFEQTERSLLAEIAEKESKLKHLQLELELMMQERACKQMEAMVIVEETREKYNEMQKKKDGVIHDLRDKLLSQEQLTSSVEAAISLELADKQFEIDTLRNSLKLMSTTHFLESQEIEFSKTINCELHHELHIITQRLDSREKMAAESDKCIKKLEQDIEAQHVKFEDCIKSMQSKEMNLVLDMNRLQSEVVERDVNVARLMFERECMVAHIVEVTEAIGKLSRDEDLIRRWESISEKAGVKSSREQRDHQLNTKSSVNLKHKSGVTSEVRLPLKEHNGYA